MHAKPRPILGATLGLLLGLVTVGLLWQLGVLPPDRLVLFGVTALMIVVVTGILTQRAGLVRARFTITMLLAGALVGVGLTGIPEAISAGSIDEGCSLTVSSSLGTASPASTTAIDPFAMTPEDTVEWQAATAEPLTDWDATMGFRIGGFDVPKWHNQVANADGRTEFTGSGSVADFLTDLGVQLRGTTHVYAVTNAAEGSCAVDGFVDIEATGPFETPVLITLWVALWILLLAIVVIAAAVRRTISLAERAVAPGEPTLGTGGNATTRSDDAQGTATGSPGKVTEARRRAANGSTRLDAGSADAGSTDAGSAASGRERAYGAAVPAAGAAGVAAAEDPDAATEPPGTEPFAPEPEFSPEDEPPAEPTAEPSLDEEPEPSDSVTDEIRMDDDDAADAAEPEAPVDEGHDAGDADDSGTDADDGRW